MPNRVLRDWTSSYKIKEISLPAERFFTRLIMKADDYGCFPADPMLLKANLFPLLLNDVREADISRWMAECQKAGLIVLYEASQKRYLQIIDFSQRLDKARSKYPQPSPNGSVDLDNDSLESANESVLETNPNLKQETKPKGAPPSLAEVEGYFLEKGYSAEAARNAFEYYDAANWHDSKGKAVKNWKQKMISVWFKDENKISKTASRQQMSGNEW